MTIEAVRDLARQLKDSATALAALGAELEERVTAARLAPAIKAEIDRVFVALGAREALAGVSPAELKPVLAEIRSTLLQGAKLLCPAEAGPGWAHTEAEILRSQGEGSSAFAVLLKNRIAPRLEGLEERLESPGGFFLDVGAGVGALSIAMATLWPPLRVVGIDPWPPALAIARESVRMVGLHSRIELREQAAQDLPDVNAFDLVWFAGVFINESVTEAALERVHRALRPGGWILYGILDPGTDPLAESVARLKTVLWGGCPRTPSEVEALLNSTGYVEVQALPISRAGPAAMIVGRKPS